MAGRGSNDVETVRGKTRQGFDSNSEPTYVGRPMGIRTGVIRGVVALAIALPLSVNAQPADQGETKPEATEAKPPEQGESAVRAERSDAIRSDARSLRLGDVDASKVPDSEKKTRAEKMVADQRAALSRGTDLLNEARSAKDIVQLNCVNEKLTQIKGLLRLSEQASSTMYDGLATGGGEQVNHEFTKIVVAHSRTQQLKAEAEQCVGELSVYTGETEVQVDIDENIPSNDPTLPIIPPPGPVTPPVASGF